MGCIVSDAKLSQSKSHYEFLEKKLKSIIKKSKNNSNYDCIVSVSGGKDSYYQTHYIIANFPDECICYLSFKGNGPFMLIFSKNISKTISFYAIHHFLWN